MYTCLNLGSMPYLIALMTDVNPLHWLVGGETWNAFQREATIYIVGSTISFPSQRDPLANNGIVKTKTLR